MGSPEFAANILESLNNEVEIVGVFTQPDKPVGRKQELTPPPAALKAKEMSTAKVALDKVLKMKPDFQPSLHRHLS